MKKFIKVFVFIILCICLFGCSKINDSGFEGYYGKAPNITLDNLGVCNSIAASFEVNNKSSSVMTSNNSLEQVEFMNYKLCLSPSFLVSSPTHVRSELYQGEYKSYIMFKNNEQSGYFVESNYLDPSLVDLNEFYYSFIACNGENYKNYPKNLGTFIGMKNINNHQFTFYSLTEKKTYGEHLSIYGIFEEDGNKYTFGAKYIYKNVNLNSDAINYINKKSSFAIKLGTKDGNIENISKYTKYDWEGLSCGYKLSNKMGEQYNVGPFYNSNSEKYVTKFRTVSKDIDICGIKCGMSFNKIKDSLINQGFKEIENRPAEATFLYGNVILNVQKNGYDDELSGNIEIFSITITIAYSLNIAVMID